MKKAASKATGSMSSTRKAAKIKCFVGDMIAIRLKPKAFAIGKVTFISKKIKGLIVINVFDKVFELAEVPEKVPSKFVRPIWTGIAYIENARWKKVGNAPLTKDSSQNNFPIWRS
jgi:hypothetical protein